MIEDILTRVLNNQTFVRVVLSKSKEKEIIKTVLTRHKEKNDDVIQAETFYRDGKARHRRFSTEALAVELDDAAAQYRQIDLITSGGSCTVMISKEGKLHIADRTQKMPPKQVAQDKPIENVKRYILDTPSAVPFLRFLSVCSENGTVYDKKRAKYKQINRFLEILSDVYPSLPQNGQLTVCDLCCGKAYLTFAVYWYLTQICGRDVCMYGVDRKDDVIRLCANGADSLGFDGLHFISGDITNFTPEQNPDLVISLHACDIATDLVLSSAVRRKAKVILSTPCCHHEINRQVNCPTLSCITQHSILKQKMCDAVTDSLRALRLEAENYQVTALELIDPDETPKNVMLRCVLRKNPMPPKKREALLNEYDRVCTFFGVKPSIGTMLS